MSEFVIARQRFIEHHGNTRPCTDEEAKTVPGTTWTGYAVFMPAYDPEQLRRDLDRRAFRCVNLLPSQKPGGVWLIGGHHWLEQAIADLEREPIAG